MVSLFEAIMFPSVIVDENSAKRLSCPMRSYFSVDQTPS